MAKNGVLTPAQRRFAVHLSKLTGGKLRPNTIGAWELAESNGSPGQGYGDGQRRGHNYLNIGITDSGPVSAGSHASLYGSPEKAAETTLKFLEGKIPGYRAAPAIQQIIPKAAHKSPSQQLAIIAASPWASSHYNGGSNLMGTLRLVESREDLPGLASHDSTGPAMSTRAGNGQQPANSSGMTPAQLKAIGALIDKNPSLGSDPTLDSLSDDSEGISDALTKWRHGGSIMDFAVGVKTARDKAALYKSALAGSGQGAQGSQFSNLLGALGVTPGQAGEDGQGSGSGSQGQRGYPLGAQAKVIGTPFSGTHTLGNWQSDRAVDLRVAEGTPMLAVEPVTVVKVKHHPQDGGRFAGDQITLRGASGREYFYAHGKASVKVGEKIAEGGKLGVTGSANGVPHLHFGQSDGNPVHWVEKHPYAATAARPASSAPTAGRGHGATGKLIITGPNPGRIKTPVIRFAEKVSAVLGHPITGSDGSTHSKYTTTGNISDHWSGYATDIPAVGTKLIHYGQAALVAAGMSPAKARQQRSGLFNINGHQIIFNVNSRALGGDHTDHLHISAH